MFDPYDDGPSQPDAAAGGGGAAPFSANVSGPPDQDGSAALLFSSHREAFSRYFTSNPDREWHIKELLRVVDTGRSFSLTVDATELLDEFPALGSAFLKSAQEVLPFLQDDVLPELQRQYAEALGGTGAVPKMVKPRVKIRPEGIPPCTSMRKESVSAIRNDEINTLVSFTGTVVRAGPVKALEEWRVFACVRCGHQFRMVAIPELSFRMDKPSVCPRAPRQVNKPTQDKKSKKWFTVKATERCDGSHFRVVEPHELQAESHPAAITDVQEIRVQESVENLKGGVIPRVMPVIVKDDLVARVQPGDKAEVVGFVRRRWRPFKKDQRCEGEFFLEAVNVIPKMRENIPPHLTLAQSHRPDSSSSQTTGSQAAGEPPAPLTSVGRIQEFQRFWQRRRGDEFAARREILDGVCPTLMGLHVAKLSLLLTLIGGCTMEEAAKSTDEGRRWAHFRSSHSPPAKKALQDGDQVAPDEPMADAQEMPAQPHRQQQQQQQGRQVGGGGSVGRCDCHMLMVGDPGTGKSQLLKKAAELSYRSVQTTGLGCTAAGLTFTCVREGADFMLEAGALVLADGGVCCIDEFSCIKKDESAAIHEALEQQSISVAKAGINTRLNTRCSVVAACNVKNGSYNAGPMTPLNTSLGLPLLTRFDTVVVFIDAFDAKQDAATADFILSKVMADPSAAFKHGTAPPRPPHFWTTDRLRDYIAHVKSSLAPTLSKAAGVLLETYFVELKRKAGPIDGAAVTVRMLESLIRLTQAHARLLHREVAELRDAVATVLMMEKALNGRQVCAAVSRSADAPARTGMLGELAAFDSEAAGPNARSTILSRATEDAATASELHFDIKSIREYAHYERQVLKSLMLRKTPDGQLKSMVDNGRLQPDDDHGDPDEGPFATPVGPPGDLNGLHQSTTGGPPADDDGDLDDLLDDLNDFSYNPPAASAPIRPPNFATNDAQECRPLWSARPGVVRRPPVRRDGQWLGVKEREMG
ncbi:unnamed protein product [Vitrella brassicaformis CCMP3155]|uniref:DNA helicase n=2 Tax=Vitrella brassicaformis TaxID=1169539 RepID=A0A0G4EB78_VITBC|nr:unnamed protein product [Vitrella brassicaformis CCMP3155]|eukprot:CEL93215.1 unnamed protein product [Vitrella brassicaformis CCMP3155]